MEIIKYGGFDRARCQHCNTELRFNSNDLHWYHGEPDYYCIVCPVCGQWVWINKNAETCRMYREGEGASN